MIKSNPTPAGWATHKLENNYITEFLPQDPEIWAPCQDPQPGGLPLGEGALRAFGLKASRA